MATIRIYPDTRRMKKDGTSQIKIVVYHKQGQRYVPLGIHILPEHWDAARGLAKAQCRLHRQINARVGQVALAAEQALVMLAPSATLDEAVAAVKAAVYGADAEACDEPRAPTLVEACRRRMSMKAERSTSRSYGFTIKHIEDYCGDCSLDEVTCGWLDGLDASMARTARSANARAIYMRNLRAVFNYAIDEGWTQNYPFRRWRIKTVRTAKRSLQAAELRSLLTMEVEEWQRQYRDFFALSFYLIGSNAKDLLYLPAGADARGRVEFNRAKTKKLYSIRVEPEAKAIIDRYRGRSHLLSAMDTRSDHQQYIKQCNHAIKRIGLTCEPGRKPQGAPLFPEVTTYWARHSWATIAAELDIPKETIAAALGHDMGNSTTAIYINFNQAKVDEANRRVIDYVLYGKR